MIIKEREFKLCKIVDKTSVKGGHFQLSLHDSQNILLKVKDHKIPEDEVYKTHGALKIQIPNAEISSYLNLEEGVLGLVTGGKNMGCWGEVIKIEKPKGPYSKTITLKNDDGNLFKTLIDYVFIIGQGVPWISMPGEIVK